MTEGPPPFLRGGQEALEEMRLKNSTIKPFVAEEYWAQTPQPNVYAEIYRNDSKWILPWEVRIAQQSTPKAPPMYLSGRRWSCWSYEGAVKLATRKVTKIIRKNAREKPTLITRIPPNSR